MNASTRFQLQWKSIKVSHTINKQWNMHTELWEHAYKLLFNILKLIHFKWKIKISFAFLNVLYMILLWLTSLLIHFSKIFNSNYSTSTGILRNLNYLNKNLKPLLIRQLSGAKVFTTHFDDTRMLWNLAPYIVSFRHVYCHRPFIRDDFNFVGFIRPMIMEVSFICRIALLTVCFVNTTYFITPDDPGNSLWGFVTLTVTWDKRVSISGYNLQFEHKSLMVCQGLSEVK